MIFVLDASMAVAMVLGHSTDKKILGKVSSAKWVIAPDLFVAEVSNVFWKYHHFEAMPIRDCEASLQNSLGLVDDLVDSKELYQEAFALACQAAHPVYDALYLALARRHNAYLLTNDKKLVKLAQKNSIRTVADLLYS